MVVKIMRWRPWPIMVSKKFQLNLVVHSLEALCVEGENGGLKESSKLMAHIKWKGPRRKLGSRFRSIRRNCTSLQCIGDGGTVEWNESFDHVCVLALQKDNVFHSWEVRIQVVNDIANESRTRPMVVGTASLNLGEFASPEENIKRTTKIPISCCIGGVTAEATLIVTLDFTDLQITQVTFDPVQKLLVPLSCITGPVSEMGSLKGCTKKSNTDSSDEDSSDYKRSPLSEEFESVDYSESESTDECEVGKDGNVLSFYGSFNYDSLAAANLFAAAVYLDSKKYANGEELKNNELAFESLPTLIDEPSSSESDHSTPKASKRSLLSWKSRKFSFKSPKSKGEPLLNKACREEGGDDIDFYRRQSTSYEATYEDNKNGARSNISAFGDDQFTIGSWEQKELISRDGLMKLSTQVFFGSIDQCSERAAGESACTALVAVIAHWLHSNPNSMPIKSQFDTLIREGSQEWRKLCDVEDYREKFPDKHFDLDTILQSKVRPLSVVPERSFVGFFRPEGLGDCFDFLKGAMSFDDIWDEITKASMGEAQEDKQHIYIVSWNDHFFVLKVERDSFYIIDTLGERLFEGCTQAFILKFDKDTTIYQLPAKEQQTRASTSPNAKDSKSLVTDSKSLTEDDGKSSVAKDLKTSKGKDSKSTESKDSKPIAMKDSKSRESKDSKSTAMKDSRYATEKDGKFSTTKYFKTSTVKGSNSAMSRDSKSVAVKDSKSTTEEDGKSLATNDLKNSTAEDSNIPTENAKKEHEENSVVKLGYLGELHTSPDKDSDNDDKQICKGKESCKAFINGFLAALPLRELQVDLEKGLMGKISLHHRLQVEFHFTAEQQLPTC